MIGWSPTSVWKAAGMSLGMMVSLVFVAAAGADNSLKDRDSRDGELRQCIQKAVVSVSGVGIKNLAWQPAYQALRIEMTTRSITELADTIKAIQRAQCGQSVELRTATDGPERAPLSAGIDVIPYAPTAPPPTPTSRQDGLDPWTSYANVDSQTESGRRYVTGVMGKDALPESIRHCTCQTDGTSEQATAHLSYVVRVDASGALREVHFDNPQTRFKACLSDQMKSRSLPVPPKDNFWFGLRMAGP
jgi:hypothetical protein